MSDPSFPACTTRVARIACVEDRSDIKAVPWERLARLNIRNEVTPVGESLTASTGKTEKARLRSIAAHKRQVALTCEAEEDL